MLLGAPVMLALMRDRGNDRRLIVIPAMGGDAGLLADFRARAVGADQEPRRDRLAAGKLHVETLDLYSPRSRRMFAARAAQVLGATVEAVENDLSDMLVAVDRAQREAARTASAPVANFIGGHA